MVRKTKNPTRNKKIEVVLNEEEKKRILEIAKREGLPASTFIRWKLLKEFW